MIDVHAHVYPSLSQQAKRLLQALPGNAGLFLGAGLSAALEAGPVKKVGESAALAAALLKGLLPKKGLVPSLTIEQFADLPSKLPSGIAERLEALSSLALAPQVLLTGTVSQLLASMDRAGIEQTVVIGVAPVGSNAWLLDEVWPVAPDRLIPVTVLPELDPSAPPERWQDELEGLALRGARGFKIHPYLDPLEPSHHAYRAVFEVAKAHGLFVVLHTGCFHVPVYRRKGELDPAAFEAFFQSYPEVKVCLAHMGRHRPEGVWALMKRYEQLYTDTSWQPARNIARALEEVGSDRILLGSDWPLLHQDLQHDAVSVLRSAVSDADFEKVTHKNAQSFLGHGAPSHDDSEDLEETPDSDEAPEPHSSAAPEESKATDEHAGPRSGRKVLSPTSPVVHKRAAQGPAKKKASPKPKGASRKPRADS